MASTAIKPESTLLPRAPGGTGRGAALSLLVHGGLVAALAYGVAWRSPAPDVVSAELWAAVPQIAAPQAVEPEPPVQPKPLPPVQKVTPPPAPSPAVPDAQIAIEKARKEQTAKAEKAEREKELQAKADKAERLEREKAAAEEARLAQQREENLKRMLNQIGGAKSNERSTGTAAVAAAPSSGYAGRLVSVIRPNILWTESTAGIGKADVEVRAAPNGSIISRRLLKSSGSKEWDDAVLRAIDRTETLPRDTDGRVPASLEIGFRPQD